MLRQVLIDACLGKTNKESTVVYLIYYHTTTQYCRVISNVIHENTRHKASSMQSFIELGTPSDEITQWCAAVIAFAKRHHMDRTYVLPTPLYLPTYSYMPNIRAANPYLKKIFQNTK